VPGIEALLPNPDVVTRHEITLPLPPERALDVALATPARPDGVVRMLFLLRGLRPDSRGTLGSIFPRLELTPTEAVFGFSGRPWRPTGGGLGSFEDARAGSVRMALGFRAEPVGEGSRLVTETRVAAVDDRARRAFRRYWRVVGPFSGLVRKRWLAAVGKRATT
jgi:hypothetical protein